ncbi:MAG: hypothetical protein ACE5EX_06160 [Phycisphaerae bacterium]
MSSESALHRRLKRAACRWLWERGYAAVAEEVSVPGVGIIDVVAAGKWRRRNPRRPAFDREPGVDRRHIVFVECKAMRSDFLRDQGRQEQFAFALQERAALRRARRRHRPRHASGALGKFDACLIRPHANLHYLLTPPGLVKVNEVPRRWGWLLYRDGHLSVVRRPAWQEVAQVAGIEGAIARALTAARMRAAHPRPIGEGEHLYAPSYFAVPLP